MKILGLLGSLLVIAASYMPLCDQRWPPPRRDTTPNVKHEVVQEDISLPFVRPPLTLQDRPAVALLVLALAFASAVLTITNRQRALWGTALANSALVLYIIGPALAHGEVERVRAGLVVMMAGVSALVSAAALSRKPDRRP